MLSRTAVWVTALLCATLIALGLMGGIVALAMTGHPVDVLTSVFSIGNLGTLIYVLAKVKAIEHNTNGTTSKLTDAIIANSTTATAPAPVTTVEGQS